LRALAFVAVAEGVVAIAAEEELVLVPREEGAGVVFVAEQGVEAGAALMSAKTFGYSAR
jgi:hypothetical protein